MYQWFSTLVLMSSLVNVRCLVNNLNGMPSDTNYFSKIHGRPTNLTSADGGMASPVAWRDIVKKFIKHRRLQDEKDTEEEIVVNSTPAPLGSQDIDYEIEHGKRNEIKNSLETGHNENYGYNEEYASPYQKIRDKKDRNKRGHNKKKRNKKYKSEEDGMSHDEESGESDVSAKKRKKKKVKKEKKAPKHKKKEKEEEEDDENYDDEDIIVEDDEENFRKPISETTKPTTKNLIVKTNLTTNPPALAVKSSTSVMVLSYLKIIVISMINFYQ